MQRDHRRIIGWQHQNRVATTSRRDANMPKVLAIGVYVDNTERAVELCTNRLGFLVLQRERT